MFIEREDISRHTIQRMALRKMWIDLNSILKALDNPSFMGIYQCLLHIKSSIKPANAGFMLLETWMIYMVQK